MKRGVDNHATRGEGGTRLTLEYEARARGKRGGRGRGDGVEEEGEGDVSLGIDQAESRSKKLFLCLLHVSRRGQAGTRGSSEQTHHPGRGGRRQASM